MLFFQDYLVADSRVPDEGDNFNATLKNTHFSQPALKYQSGLLDTEQAAAAARISAALVEQNAQARLFVQEIEHVWCLIKTQGAAGES